jgi:hypothetical protein
MSKESKRAPFHAPDDPVYHDNSKCDAGRKIIANRKDGTGQRSHCPECAKLNTTD